MTSLLALESLASLDAATFRRREPFPWHELTELFSAETFARLYTEFPSRARFERHDGRPRRFGQRPHDRFYLELGGSIYHGGARDAPGVIQLRELSPTWRCVVRELLHGPYRRQVLRLLGADDARLRLTWHIGVDGDGVSPHRDVREKLGTHLFYFNPEDQWHRDWGGETVLLGGRRTLSHGVDFDDFDTRTAVSCRGNRSLLIANLAEAWHAVRDLSVPPHAERRVFSVVFDRPGKRIARFVDWAEAFVWQRVGPLARRLGA